MTKPYTLVDHASDAALAIDGKSRIVACNAACAHLLGYAVGEPLMRSCHEVLQAILPNGEPVCTPACEARHRFEQCKPFAVPACSVRRKDGSWIEVGIGTLLIPASSGRSCRSDQIVIVFMHPKEDAATRVCGEKRLRVYALGRFGLAVEGRSLPTDRWQRKQALTLLKVLITHAGEAVHRDRVIAYLWSDADERRGSERLKVITYFLREQFRQAGLSSDIIIVTGASYTLKRDAIWLDCDAFKGFFKQGKLLAERGQAHEALACFENAERLYRGDYLPEEPYADWCAEEREYLREIYLDVLAHLIRGYLINKDYERAVEVCHMGLTREPYREGFHRALIVSLAGLDQRERALAHYNRCRELLKAELGVDPSPETQRVYREFLIARQPECSGAPLRR